MIYFPGDKYAGICPEITLCEVNLGYIGPLFDMWALSWGVPSDFLWGVIFDLARGIYTADQAAREITRDPFNRGGSIPWNH